MPPFPLPLHACVLYHFNCISLLQFYLLNAIFINHSFLFHQMVSKTPFWRGGGRAPLVNLGRHRQVDYPGFTGQPLALSGSPRSVRDLCQETRLTVPEEQHLRLLSGFYTHVYSYPYAWAPTHVHQHTCVYTHRERKWKENTLLDGWIMILLNLCSSVGCLVYFLCLYPNSKHFFYIRFCLSFF